MARSRNLVLGALATGLIAVGVAAQTGTVHVPHLNEPRATAVTHQSTGPAPVVVEPSVRATQQPAPQQPVPQPAPQQPVPQPVPQPAPPPANNGGDGDDEDGG
jgi:outer membrane biosynthesis protein TonB